MDNNSLEVEPEVQSSVLRLERQHRLRLSHFRSLRRQRLMASHNRHTLSNNIIVDDYGICSSNSICNCFTGLCCCQNNVHKSTRIKVLWVWLFVFAIASCFILGFLVYYPDTPLASPSDMRVVTKHVDYLFCEEVQIISPQTTFDAFRVTDDLTIDKFNREIKTFDKSALFIEATHFNYFTFYFLAGSFIDIKHSTQSDTIFYVFKGQTNFNTWKGDSGCENCYFEKMYLHSDDGMRFSMEMEDEDQFFFVYFAENEDTWVTFDIFVNRTIYDVTNAIQVCTDTTECNVILTNQNDKAVYQVDDFYDIGNFNHPKFTTKCVPRVWSYLVVHGVGILIIGMVCSFLIQKCTRNPDTYQRYNVQGTASERTPLLYEPLPPPTYSSVILSPPKYDDLMRYTDPPPYTDAVNALYGSAASCNTNSLNDNINTQTEHYNTSDTCHNHSKVAQIGESSYVEHPDSHSSLNAFNTSEQSNNSARLVLTNQAFISDRNREESYFVGDVSYNSPTDGVTSNCNDGIAQNIQNPSLQELPLNTDSYTSSTVTHNVPTTDSIFSVNS